jgi:hypothetical protein
VNQGASRQPSRRFDRRSFIAGGVAAAGAAVWTASTNPARASAPASGPAPRFGAMRWKGVNLDTDRSLWQPNFVRNELASIAGDLHANAVLILGSDLERLADSAAMAAEEDLSVWLEPRHFDAGASETLEFVGDVAARAEALRRNHPAIGLSLGVELTLFLDGLVPGDDWLERGGNLQTADPDEYNAALNAFLSHGVESIGQIFGGLLTYSSGPWEQVDWTPFDVVGVDLYRNAENRETYVDELRAYLGHGKPVIITEFGCCTFDGAADLGGEGFIETMDGDVSDLVRDEQEQATEIAELLDLYAAEAVDGAFVYNFIEPDNTYSPDPAEDFDKAGFSLVRCHAPGSALAYETAGHFEPKRSFDAVAQRFR